MSKQARSERRTSVRFPLAFDLRYKVVGESVVIAGSGRTIDVASTGMSFTADSPLSIGQNLDVSIDWPVPLNSGVRLQLRMSGTVVRTDGNITALRIHAHEFRTRSLGPQLEPTRRFGR